MMVWAICLIFGYLDPLGKGFVRLLSEAKKDTDLQHMHGPETLEMYIWHRHGRRLIRGI